MSLGTRIRRAIASAVALAAVAGAAGTTGLSPVLRLDPAWFGPVEPAPLHHLVTALAVGFAIGLALAVAILLPRLRRRRSAPRLRVRPR